MKLLYFLVLSMLCSLLSFAQPTLDWSTIDSIYYYYGGTVTSDNKYLAAGQDHGTIPYNSLLVKYNCSGQRLWSKHFGDGNLIKDVIETTDHNYICFGDSSLERVFLTKTTTSGAIIWSRKYPKLYSTREVSKSVANAHDGGYVFAATFIAACYCGIRVTKTDSLGNIQWDKVLSFVDRDGGAIIASPNNTYTLLSLGDYSTDTLYLDQLDSAGNVVWHASFPNIRHSHLYSKSLIVTNDGGFAFTGFVIDTLFLIKTDAYGNLQWKKSYALNFTSSGHGISQTRDGGYLWVGDEYNSAVFKTDSSGNLLWQISYIGTSISASIAFEAADSGYFYAGTGEYDTTFSNGWQAVARKFIDGTPCLFTANSESTIEQSISITPNPTTGKLKIRNEQLKIESIHIYNLLGKEVMTTSVADEIDLTPLPSGMYIVEVSGDNFLWRGKILKTDY